MKDKEDIKMETEKKEDFEMSSTLMALMTAEMVRFRTQGADNRASNMQSLYDAQRELEKTSKMKFGESMLSNQAHTLDVLFNDITQMAVEFMPVRGGNTTTTELKVFEGYLKLALKAQNQCKSTLLALNEIRNPKQVMITKQANVSGQQVVNNGVINAADKPDFGQASHAHTGKNENEANELTSIGEIHHETLERGITGSTTPTDNENSTVVKINRS